MTTTRIIPGAVTTTSLRALVLSESPSPPPLTLVDVRGAPAPALKVRAHGSGDPRFDQHVIGAGVYLYFAEATGLKPARDYQITGQIGATHIKTLPTRLPKDGLRIALASCYSDEFKRHGDYLKVLQGAGGFGQLSAKLLVGDNLYLDVGTVAAETRTGFEDTAERYLQYFWRSGYADVLSYLPTFTLWDDHEFWNNYPEHQIWLPRSMGRKHVEYSAAALAGLKAFQAVLNPTPAARNGLSYQFDLGELSLFALDLRSGRTQQAAPRPMMCSESELVAFERWAAGLTGPGALVVGQPLWTRAGDWQDWNPPAYAAQFARIWRALTDAPWDIAILTGDVHHSRVLEIEVGPGRRVWEVVSSPAAHIPTVESIAARAYDNQDAGRVGFVLDVAISDVRPRLVAYHMGTGVPNTIALLRLRPAEDGGVEFSGTFIDLVRKTACPSSPAPPGSPVAEGAPAMCSKDPLFVLRKREA